MIHPVPSARDVARSLLVVLLACWASPAPAPIIPAAAGYVVQNGAAVPLRCRARMPSASWGAWFGIRPGGEWRAQRSRTGAAASLFCGSPAAATVYAIKPGRRYVFLRNAAGGTIELRDVTPR